jgi:hypothetical protein
MQTLCRITETKRRILQMEVTEKTQAIIFQPHIDTSKDLEDFLINEEIERIIMHLIMWTAIIMLCNIFAW